MNFHNLLDFFFKKKPLEIYFMTLGQSSIVEVFVYHLSAKRMKLTKDNMMVLLKMRRFLQDRLVSIDLGFIIIICLVLH